MATTVVNVYKEPYDVYVGRMPEFGNTKWGNPFKDESMPLEQKLAMYEMMVRSKDEMWDALDELKDKKLGCHCDPKPCHGHVLVKLVNEKFGIDDSFNNKFFK